jgi:hypothetical protein
VAASNGYLTCEEILLSKGADQWLKNLITPADSQTKGAKSIGMVNYEDLGKVFSKIVGLINY